MLKYTNSNKRILLETSARIWRMFWKAEAGTQPKAKGALQNQSTQTDPYKVDLYVHMQATASTFENNTQIQEWNLQGEFVTIRNVDFIYM